jgi:hypothetical protein
MKIISLGLGVQSVALYYMSSIGELPRVDAAIMADPGKEKDRTYKYLSYLQTWQVNNNGIPILVVQEKNLYDDLLHKANGTAGRFASIPAFVQNNQGETGMLKRQCTYDYKILQVNGMIRKIYGIPLGKRLPLTEVWKGISADELERMNAPKEAWKKIVYPFTGFWFDKKNWGRFADAVVMRRSDILHWYEKKGLPAPGKSSCVFCPYQSDASWARLKKESPADFEAAVRVDDAIRIDPASRIKSSCYLHRSLRPLREINFDRGNNLEFGNCTDECDI